MSSQATIITRTFSLIPRAPGKNGAYQRIKERMVAFRELENAYIDVLVEALNQGRLMVADFSGESKAHVKRKVYNKLKLNEIHETHPARITLKERMLRCAVQYPYFAVREWLVRSHYLSVILKELIQLISQSPRHIVRLLQGSVLSRAAMKRLSHALFADCFGKDTPLSFFYLQNLLGQLRNLFFSTSSMERVLNARLTEFKANPPLIDEFTGDVLRSFTRKRKGKLETILASELTSHFLKRYVAQVKRKNTWHAKHVLKHPDASRFKRGREQAFAPLVESLKEQLEGLPSEFIANLAKNAIYEIIDQYLEDTRRSLTKHVFKPVRRAPRVAMTLSREGFQEYLTQVVKNQLKHRLKDNFLTTPIINGVALELKKLDDTLRSVMKPPRIRRLALPINQEESVYSPDFDHLQLNLSFISRELFELDIKDQKGRIQSLLKQGASPRLPVITMKGRKLLLHLPLELNSNDLLKQSPLPSESNSEQERIEIGVDLGLKHLAVLSVMNRTDPENPVELARYFLNTRTLLDMKFNDKSGRFEPQARFSNTHSNNTNNQKNKLRNLRREARNLQRKVHEYENRFLERAQVIPKNKYKHYRLKRDLSRSWERVNRMNRELVRQLQHVIIEIATYHGASLLKFENLKWSRHSNKQKTGGWLSFWQAHWFFSQVQEAVEFQANLRGIAFRRVKAAFTSQDCWECHQRGLRAGRSFTCTNSAHHASKRAIRLHSDLNAARVIALS